MLLLIKENIGLNRVETNNFLRCFVANIIICTLATETPGPNFLLNSEILAKTNNLIMEKLFDNSMYILWSEKVHRNEVLLYLNDATPYMVKRGKTTKIFYFRVSHVLFLSFTV